MDLGAVDSSHPPYSWYSAHVVDTAWADVPAELHDRLFQVSEDPRRGVGCWVVCYSWSYSLSLAALRKSLFFLRYSHFEVISIM